MNTTERIFELMKIKKITGAQLSRATGISQGNISDWKKGKANPSYGAIVKIASALGVDADEIKNVNENNALITHVDGRNELQLLDERSLVNTYRDMTDIGKELLLESAKEIWAMHRIRKPKLELVTFAAKQEPIKDNLDVDYEEIEMENVKVFNMPASAGSGELLDDNAYAETLCFPAIQVPPQTDFGIRISGDSMEPLLSHGQIVFIREQSTLRNGDIGVFIVDNEGYCKRYNRVDECLESINLKYEPLPFKNFLDMRIVGRVLF